MNFKAIVSAMLVFCLCMQVQYVYTQDEDETVVRAETPSQGKDEAAGFGRNAAALANVDRMLTFIPKSYWSSKSKSVPQKWSMPWLTIKANTGGQDQERLTDLQLTNDRGSLAGDANNALTLFELLANVSNKDAGCTCSIGSCQCCIDLSVVVVHSRACIGFHYLPPDFSIQISISIDGKVLVQKKVPAQHPLPVCVGVSELGPPFNFCIDAKQLGVSFTIAFAFTITV